MSGMDDEEIAATGERLAKVFVEFMSTMLIEDIDNETQAALVSPSGRGLVTPSTSAGRTPLLSPSRSPMSPWRSLP